VYICKRMQQAGGKRRKVVWLRPSRTSQQAAENHFGTFEARSEKGKAEQRGFFFLTLAFFTLKGRRRESSVLRTKVTLSFPRLPSVSVNSFHSRPLSVRLSSVVSSSSSFPGKKKGLKNPYFALSPTK